MIERRMRCAWPEPARRELYMLVGAAFGPFFLRSHQLEPIEYKSDATAEL
jgi:hypothetical protein